MTLFTVKSGFQNFPVIRKLLLALLAVTLGGALISAFYNRLTRTLPVKEVLANHSMQETRTEIKTRFQQGVMMLHAKRFDEAATAFHRVIELAPELPEAHVNMGYALLGLQRYEAARDFFESATILKPDQANAYFGLAEALENLKDIPGALGAMRTYAHLVPTSDPYRRKAESAIWEWEEALKLQRESKAASADQAATPP